MMFDPDLIYTSQYVRDEIYFSTRVDNPGVVELHLPGETRTLKLSIAAAEDLLINLEINADTARHFAKKRT